MGTAERRIEMMKLLCKKRHMTMPDLANEFNVSIRTIKRDIDEITFFIPIYVKSGRYDGGVYVAKNYKMGRMYMTSEETDLLKKVKTIVSNKLSEKENSMLEYIINNYSK